MSNEKCFFFVELDLKCDVNKSRENGALVSIKAYQLANNKTSIKFLTKIVCASLTADKCLEQLIWKIVGSQIVFFFLIYFSIFFFVNFSISFC